MSNWRESVWKNVALISFSRKLKVFIAHPGEVGISSE